MKAHRNVRPKAIRSTAKARRLAVVGLALILGIGMRIAAVTGALLYVLMWTAALPPENNPVLDDHILGAITLVALALVAAGNVWGRAALGLHDQEPGPCRPVDRCATQLPADWCRKCLLCGALARHGRVVLLTQFRRIPGAGVKCSPSRSIATSAAGMRSRCSATCLRGRSPLSSGESRFAKVRS
ncbi:hypothetical protein AB0F43_20835 [Kribbella sp. NPDC023972]|uniref:hypothetical protein n=1 Tax=Kribbella sp. NPDC023972 TaxID=3154795 RepID=UPI0033F86C98